MNSRVQALVLRLGAVVALVVLDQFTKLLSLQFLSLTPQPLMPFVSLTLACNTGAAFSLFEGQLPLLTIIACILSVVLFVLLIRLPKEYSLQSLALPLILAGAIGNVIDRIVRGCVVDFIHLHAGNHSFPIFNVADSLITIGVCLWIFALWRTPPKKQLDFDQPGEGKHAEESSET